MIIALFGQNLEKTIKFSDLYNKLNDEIPSGVQHKDVFISSEWEDWEKEITNKTPHKKTPLP